MAGDDAWRPTTGDVALLVHCFGPLARRACVFVTESLRLEPSNDTHIHTAKRSTCIDALFTFSVGSLEYYSPALEILFHRAFRRHRVSYIRSFGRIVFTRMSVPVSVLCDKSVKSRMLDREARTEDAGR